MSTIICPAKECSKRFKSYKALSCHQHCCKFMPGVVLVVAKCYVEFDGIVRAQKRCRTSFSSTAGDEDQQNDAEAIDFESQKQQREEAAAEEAMRQAGLPTPTLPPHPITPVKLQTIQTEEDEFGQYRVYQKRPDHEPGNFPQLDHNDFAAETHQANSKDLGSGLHMLVLSLSELPGLVGLFLNATIVSGPLALGLTKLRRGARGPGRVAS
ncbi:hypothetical protein BDM02DRAFT_3188327 [Thelephora ganbajun]|uniref:Uncharacterized protein n=1 Tax=Thelephora ganbajun TaxID=370292 RepID=A0ACB6ZBW1_THEGA|nr:hypothetical protein BDM02DRAFT_3188327 [Thelephora ganbajun]